ncbi:Aminodeoxychorismate lyase [Nitrosospira multiformis ATCC 25196]|nr:Aminodeoxychorismate lyase [Nitrosospira multiformis ATCC 25196]
MAFFSAWVGYRVSKPVELPIVPYEFSIEQGSSVKTIASQLAYAGVLPDAWSFVLLSRLMGVATSLKAGDYELTASISPFQLLQRITRGDSSQSEIRFIEGWTFSQLRRILDEHPALRHQTTHLSNAEILRLIGATETAAEGLFFPDTYFFARGSSDVAVLKRAYRAMRNHMDSAWAQRAANLPLKDPYEALILASIVEKETGREDDRGMVAAVFINRLRSRMLLQTDPTVIYGLGDKFDGNLRKKDLLSDQEYNTYIRPGLPPTPIALPGLASIRAVLNPATTDALYFVAKGNGESHFSSNLSDHNRAVSKYQKR